jgi:hypothetical protein
MEMENNEKRAEPRPDVLPVQPTPEIGPTPADAEISGQVLEHINDIEREEEEREREIERIKRNPSTDDRNIHPPHKTPQ